MLTLYFFGRVVEQYFTLIFGSTIGIVLYVVLYVSAIAVSSIWDLVKYRNDWNYNAVGASGAVSAILFASILFEPKMGIYIYLIPIPVPGYIFAPLYLLYCWYMARRNMDNMAPVPARMPSGHLSPLPRATRALTRSLHIDTRTFSILLLLSLLQSCGTPRRLSKASRVNAAYSSTS